MESSELLPGVEDPPFFWRQGAAGHEHGCLGVDLEECPEQPCWGVLGAAGDSVELHRSCDVDAFRGDFQVQQSFCTRPRLCGHESDAGKDGPQESLCPQIPSEAAFAETCIDDCHGDLLTAAFEQESGPEFEFDEDEETGANGGESVSNGPGKIERKPDQLTAGKTLLCEVISGVSGGGNNDVPGITCLFTEFFDNFLQLDDFANTDGMKPGGGSMIRGRGELAEEFLSEAASVPSVAEHTPDDDG